MEEYLEGDDERLVADGVGDADVVDPGVVGVLRSHGGDYELGNDGVALSCRDVQSSVLGSDGLGNRKITSTIDIFRPEASLDGVFSSRICRLCSLCR